MTMIETFFATEYISTPVVFMRLSAAAVLGLLVGVDREIKNKPIGFRPYMLVSVGAAGFAIIVMEITMMFDRTEGLASVDPSRVMQGVVGGIGFLGAGAIIQAGGDVRGASTGAGIWLVGGVGLACGFGFFNHAAALTVTALAVLVIGGGLKSHLAQDSSSDENEKY